MHGLSLSKFITGVFLVLFVGGAILLEVNASRAGLSAPFSSIQLLRLMCVGIIMFFVPILFLLKGKEKGFQECDIQRVILIHFGAGLISLGILWIFTTVIFTSQFFSNRPEVECDDSSK